MMLNTLSLRRVAADPLFPRLPELDSRAVRLPAAEALADWRKQANLRMEDALAHFDAALIEGHSAEHAARAAMQDVMGWVRASIGEFRTSEGALVVRGELRDAFVQAWSDRDGQVLLRAAEDADCVDRHLRLFIGLAYESAARGYASLLLS